jgi:hypothetical protein
MYHTNMHLFNSNRTGKMIGGFIKDKTLIAYTGYSIKSFFSSNLLMTSFTKVLM